MPTPVPQRVSAGRPWDELAPWWPPEDPVLDAVRRQARRLGVAYAIALTTILERSLAAADVAAIDPTAVATLDALARDARVTVPTGGAVRVYLRQLTPRLKSAPRSAGTGPVLIPARVVARLGGASDAELASLLNCDIVAALAWERAAVSRGSTIGEWAGWQLARLLAQPARPSAAPQPTGS